MAETLQRRMATGAIWMVMFKIVERGLGLISTLILARLLAPADFGVVAMALSFIVMAELLTAFGFDVAIIQNRSATREHLNSAWTCNMVLGLAITLLMLVAAYPISHFYRNPGLAWVVMALAFGPLIAGCENIGVVAFRKELDFRREFRFQLSRKLVSFAIVVPLALVLRSYWALVVGIIVSKLAGTVISYLMHPFRPRPSLAHVRELLVFSRWLLLNNFVAFFKDRSSDFFIGRLSGAASLGTYNVAYELANLPTTEISAPINRALLPGFSKMVTPEEVSAAYANAVGLLVVLALPAAGCIFLLARFIVPVLLGPKWLDAVALMQVFAFNGALLMLHSSICAVLIGRGFPARVMVTNGAYAAVLVSLLALCFAFFADRGVEMAAYAVLTTTIVATPLYLWQMKRALGVSPSVFVRALARPLVAAALMVSVIGALLPAYDATAGVHVAIAWLVTGAVCAVLLYAAALWFLWRLAGRPAGPERMVFERLRAELAGRVPHLAPRPTSNRSE